MRHWLRDPRILAVIWCGIAVLHGGALTCRGSDMPTPDSLADSGVVKFSYQASGERDPFIPLLSSSKDSVANEPSSGELFEEYFKKIKVNGVLWDKGNPLVMINNEIYRRNDLVENLRISEITPNGVTVSYKDQSRTILLIDMKKYE